MTANGAPCESRPAPAPRLAVDLGASNVKMAWLDGDRIVDSSQRNVGFPAAVGWQDGARDLVVGHDALKLATVHPEAVLLNVREWLSLVPSVRLAGEEITIADAVTAVYRRAALATVQTTDQPPAVIVHPAQWPDRRVAMLADAARAAGLDVVQTVPDAVALAAAGPREGDVMVIDVGSSMTVSVVDAGADPPRILWSRSSLGAGGEAIAQAIRAVSDVPVSRARALARGAELAVGEEPVDWAAVREEAAPGVQAARQLVDEVLFRSNRDAAAIARIYVAGGASVPPFVRESVRERFKSDKVDKVSELSGPSASAAYGALRLIRPEPINVWGSVSRSRSEASPEPVDELPLETSVDNVSSVEKVWGAASASMGTALGDETPQPLETPWASTGSPTEAPNTWPGAPAGSDPLIVAPERSDQQDRLNTWGTGGPDSRPSEPAAGPDVERSPRRWRRILVVVAIVVVLVGLGVLALRALTSGDDSPAPSGPTATEAAVKAGS